MKLYVVLAKLGDYSEFKGVFSSKELAKEQVKQVNKGYGYSLCYIEEV